MREDMASGQKTLREDMASGQKALREDTASGQKALREDLANAQKATFESQRDMEIRLLREIVRSKERIVLLLKVANLSEENAALLKQLEQKKTSPPSAQ